MTEVRAEEGAALLGMGLAGEAGLGLGAQVT